MRYEIIEGFIFCSGKQKGIKLFTQVFFCLSELMSVTDAMGLSCLQRKGYVILLF